MTVTIEELLKDIEETKKEIDACEKIVDGLRTLRSLPDSDPARHRFDLLKYESHLDGSREFLAKLLEIHKERVGDG